MKEKLEKSMFLSFKLFLFGFGLSFLSSCGQPICVAGFGQCDAPNKPTTTTQTTSTLKLTSDKTSMLVNQTATLTISGGVSPYKIEFSGTAGGSLSGSPGSFQSATSYTYTAPASAGTFTFKVTDSATPTATTTYVSIVVTASR